MSDDLAAAIEKGGVHPDDARRPADGWPVVNLDAVDFVPILAILKTLLPLARGLAEREKVELCGDTGHDMLTRLMQGWSSLNEALVAVGLTPQACWIVDDERRLTAPNEKLILAAKDLRELVSLMSKGYIGSNYDMRLTTGDDHPGTLVKAHRVELSCALFAQRLAEVVELLEESQPTPRAENGKQAGGTQLDANKPNRSTPKGDAEAHDNALRKLLRVFTNRVSDERIERATRILADEKLRANEKLEEIDNLIRFPPTASAQDLANMLGVTKTVVINSPWWVKNRRGKKADETGRRKDRHRNMAEGYETPHDKC
jgi:hypothetical protein